MTERKLSHYRILGELSRGGMGVVYRAVDERLHREVALKVLPPELVSDPERKERFEREARATASLEHPHIGVVYGFDEADGVSFIAMELIRGPKLQEAMAFEPLPFGRALDLAIEMGAGLASAHQKGVVHRDLKPSNIMLTEDGHIKIIDFGLVKLLERGAAHSESETAIRRETEPGKVMGTVEYMSPEQARGGEVDHRTDIFSFGVVLHELLAGKPPFAGNSAFETVSAILKEPAPRLALEGVSLRIVQELQRILDKCLAKSPDERYQGMKDVLVDLRQVRRLFDVTESRVGVELDPTRRRRWLVPLGAAALAGVLLYAIVAREEPVSESPRDPIPPASSRQASVAVLGFKNLTGNPETAWLSTALSEMLGTELAAGATLRVIPGEEVARMKIELELSDSDSYGSETLTQIQSNLGADYVIVGSFAVIGSEGRQIRLDAKLQDAVRGRTVAAIAETGSEVDLFQLVDRAGATMREELGVRALSSDETEQVQAAHSESLEATRFYAEGLSELRRYRAIEARVLFEKAVEEDPSFALAYAALSQAWSALGFEGRAADSARRALELAEGLPREAFLVIEGRSHETSGQRQSAVETYETLWSYHPDNVDHGLRLARAQSSAGMPADALLTIDEIRNRYPEAASDPRVDLAEAEAAAALSRYDHQLEAIGRVVDAASSQEAWLLLAEARFNQGRTLIRYGEPARAREALEEARRLFQQGENRGKVAECMNQLAILLKYEGKYDEAEEMYHGALAILRENGDRAATSYVLNNLAFMIWQAGQLANAESLLEESLSLAREVGSVDSEANSLDTMSSVYLSQGRLEEARDASRKALELAEEIGEESMAAWMLHTLGLIAHAEGSAELAGQKYEEALEVCERIGYSHLSGYVLNDQGRLLLDRGDLAGAEEKLEASSRIRSELGETGTLVKTRLNQARLALEQSREDEAIELAQRAATQFGRERMLDHEALARSVIALAELSRGRTSAARSALAPALGRVDETESPAVRLAVGIVSGRLRAASGDETALPELRRVRDACQKQGLGRLALEARLALGEVELEMGSVDIARSVLTELAGDAEALGFHRMAEKARAALQRQSNGSGDRSAMSQSR